MNHHKVNRKFGRVTKQRSALLKSLARSLVIHERIETSEAKAKEIRPYVEKMITKAKGATLADKRSLAAAVGPKAAAKLYGEVAERFAKRTSGYLRIIKTATKRTDGGKSALIEFV